MADESAKSDSKGTFPLKISTFILLLAFSLSLIFFTSQFKSHWLIIWTFLLPTSQNVIAMVFPDEIRSSFVLQMLCWLLSLTTILFASTAEASMESHVLTYQFLYLYSLGGLFQIGVGLRHSKLPVNQLVQFYGAMAACFMVSLQREKGLAVAWLWIAVLPLYFGMSLLCFKFSVDVWRRCRRSSGEVICSVGGKQLLISK